MYMFGFSVYVLFVIWVPQRCGRTLNTVSPNLAMEEPIFSMNWPSIPVQGMLALDSLITPITTFYLACTLTQPCSLLFNISRTHHYPHCAPPTFIHPSFVLPARFIILYILPFLPPGFSFLVWPGITLQWFWMGGQCLCLSFFTACECSEEEEVGVGRGSGLRMWARCQWTLIASPSQGPDSARAH